MDGGGSKDRNGLVEDCGGPPLTRFRVPRSLSRRRLARCPGCTPHPGLSTSERPVRKVGWVGRRRAVVVVCPGPVVTGRSGSAGLTHEHRTHVPSRGTVAIRRLVLVALRRRKWVVRVGVVDTGFLPGTHVGWGQNSGRWFYFNITKVLSKDSIPPSHPTHVWFFRLTLCDPLSMSHVLTLFSSI